MRNNYNQITVFPDWYVRMSSSWVRPLWLSALQMIVDAYAHSAFTHSVYKSYPPTFRLQFNAETATYILANTITGSNKERRLLLFLFFLYIRYCCHMVHPQTTAMQRATLLFTTQPSWEMIHLPVNPYCTIGLSWVPQSREDGRSSTRYVRSYTYRRPFINCEICLLRIEMFFSQ